MTWEMYYDKFYDWAESTRIKRLSSVESLGDCDSVCDVMLEFSFNRKDIADRLARMAIEQELVFSAENIIDLLWCIDDELFNELALQSADGYTEEELKELEGMLDEELIFAIYKKKGLPIPEEYIEPDYIEVNDYDDELGGAGPPKFIETLGLALAIGAGIKHGIDDVRKRED